MQKFKNRSGLALGASLALVGSLLSVPSAFASETAVVVAPNGGTSAQNSMIHTEPFELFVRYGSSVADTSGNFSYRYSVSSTSANVAIETATNPTGTWTALTGATSVSAGVGEQRGVTSGSAYVRFSLTGYNSLSAAVSIVVTPYVNKDGDAGLTAGDLQGTPYTINFVPWSSLGASLNHSTPLANDTNNTASVTVTAGTINWTQLNGQFSVLFDDTAATTTGNAGTYSAQATPASTPSTFKMSGATLESGNYSFSAGILTTALTTSSTVGSVSATLFYVATTSDIAAATSNGAAAARGLVISTKAVSERTIAGVTISPVAGANILRSGANAADARFNSAFTVNAFANTASSITTSMPAIKTVTVSAVGADMEFDADSGVILNGVTYTSSAGLLAAGFELASTVNSFTMSTFGQDSDGSGDSVTLRVTSQLVTTTLAITLKTPTLTPAYTPTAVAGLAGQTKSFELTVRDQWSQIPVRSDIRIKAVMVLSSSESEAVSSTVSGGAATVALAPTPATRTGSGTVTFTLQTFNQNTQMWDDGATDSATWNVYTYAAGTEAFTSRTATASASVSYGVAAYSWSGVVSVVVSNSFSDVVVTATGLVIENNDQTSLTASNTLTVAANGLTANVRFASKKAGTYTVTFAQGTATTTSVITISAAGDDKGSAIAYDTTTIESGKTKVITGTLTDANGNAVDTTLGNATIQISYIGTAGIVAGSLPTETDADGKFRISVLTAAADSGTLTITTTYLAQGAGTAAARLVTSTQAVNISPAAPAEVNAVIGSFNGRWAVRVENAKGSVVSVKAGKRWVKFTSLNNNYLYSMRSVKGRTIAVSVWVDGELQNSQTITIK